MEYRDCGVCVLSSIFGYNIFVCTNVSGLLALYPYYPTCVCIWNSLNEWRKIIKNSRLLCRMLNDLVCSFRAVYTTGPSVSKNVLARVVCMWGFTIFWKFHWIVIGNDVQYKSWAYLMLNIFHSFSLTHTHTHTPAIHTLFASDGCFPPLE